MAEVAKVDDRRRITLPREVGVSPGESIIIIDAHSYFLGIPISSDPLVSSGSWLNDARDVKELKREADRRAEEDATSRAKRRNQT
ncbi:MAG: VapB-type antitoxin [Nitrososphaerota archaeon]|jgi:bifunctional DNA-binding transcriptional regulator/antitoxin component of YhaV-PrlF toxin-antitoxin module|nr:VapB-type antitoxin [Nitrososphaerota archaeon]